MLCTISCVQRLDGPSLGKRVKGKTKGGGDGERDKEKKK